MPTQGAVNFFTKLQYEAAAIRPPYTVYPTPQLAREPWGRRETEARSTVKQMRRVRGDMEARAAETPRGGWTCGRAGKVRGNRGTAD